MQQPVPFETLLEEAKTLLDKLMDPSITLEESIQLYEEGISKIKKAQEMIEEAKVTIQTIEEKKE